MKFKIIFLLFNIVIIMSFLVIFFIPFTVLGWEYTRIFWSKNWFLSILFAAVIGIMNFYFVRNWRLFILLEKEDWQGVTDFIEDQLYQKGRIRVQYIRTIVNTYLVTSNTDGIVSLESFLRERKPDLITKFALYFGIPYLIRNEPEKAQEYFGSLIDNPKTGDRDWITWSYAFTFFLQQERERTMELLLPFIDEQKDPVLLLLSVYTLSICSRNDEAARKRTDEAAAKLSSRYSKSALDKAIEKQKSNIMVIMLSKLVRDAVDWLYESRDTATEAVQG